MPSLKKIQEENDKKTLDWCKKNPPKIRKYLKVKFYGEGLSIPEKDYKCDS